MAMEEPTRHDPAYKRLLWDLASVWDLDLDLIRREEVQSNFLATP